MPIFNPEFLILAVLDGWGIAPPGPGNAITLSKTPTMSGLWSGFPHTQLGAAGESVGLPRDEAGNTETGHLNLGAGTIVYQDLARINMAIADGSFFNNNALNDALKHVKENNSKLHYMGLLGAGGVHSNMEHLFALIHLARVQGITELYIHVFTDGRDSPQTASLSYIKELEAVLNREKVGKIASIMGRYWGMDRDLRWDRTAKAYYALTKGEGQFVANAEEAILKSYERGATDEFIEPTLIVEGNNPKGIIGNNDAVVFFNFRIDRPRQLSRSFLVKDSGALGAEWGFDPYSIKYTKRHTNHRGNLSPTFKREFIPKNLLFVTMTEYEELLVKNGAKVAFPPQVINMPLGRVLSENHQTQLRAAESEKERFVTFYFNGLREESFEGEERLIVPSPLIPTYDQKPEMSAPELTAKLLKKIELNGYKFILINYANVDMVGHTGNLAAAKIAVETVDRAVAELANFTLARGGSLFITADHGNAEEMLTKNNEVSTEHSTNPVPFIAVANALRGRTLGLPSGILGDVAPTVLSALNLPKPSEMLGRNLLEGVTE